MKVSAIIKKTMANKETIELNKANIIGGVVLFLIGLILATSIWFAISIKNKANQIDQNSTNIQSMYQGINQLIQINNLKTELPKDSAQTVNPQSSFME
jgi:hypothetical protein